MQKAYNAGILAYKNLAHRLESDSELFLSLIEGAEIDESFSESEYNFYPSVFFEMIDKIREHERNNNDS